MQHNCALSARHVFNDIFPIIVGPSRSFIINNSNSPRNNAVWKSDYTEKRESWADVTSYMYSDSWPMIGCLSSWAAGGSFDHQVAALLHRLSCDGFPILRHWDGKPILRRCWDTLVKQGQHVGQLYLLKIACSRIVYGNMYTVEKCLVFLNNNLSLATYRKNWPQFWWGLNSDTLWCSAKPMVDTRLLKFSCSYFTGSVKETL